MLISIQYVIVLDNYNGCLSGINGAESYADDRLMCLELQYLLDLIESRGWGLSVLFIDE